MKYASIAILTTLMTGCASHPDSIDAAYVSPFKYKDYDCDQVEMEIDHIEKRATDLYGRLKSERNADNWQMGAGIFFFPTLFFLEGGDGPEAAEYAQLRGEYEALRENSIQKKCMIASKSPEEIIKESDKREEKDQEDA